MNHVPQIGEVVTVSIQRRTITGVLCAHGHHRSIELPSGAVIAELCSARSVWRAPDLCISGWSGGMPCEWVITPASSGDPEPAGNGKAGTSNGKAGHGARGNSGAN